MSLIQELRSGNLDDCNFKYEQDHGEHYKWMIFQAFQSEYGDIKDYNYNETSKIGLELFMSYKEEERFIEPYSFYRSFVEKIESFTEPFTHIKALRITHLDRGVSDFNQFSTLLERQFPNLEYLFFSQNYGDPNVMEDFFKHPFISKISHIFVEDMQSDWNKLLSLEYEKAAFELKNCQDKTTGSRYISFYNTSCYNERFLVIIYVTYK